MKKHVQECQTTEFTANQYDFVWKLENCGLIFSTDTAKSFISKRFSLDKTAQQCFLKLDIDTVENNKKTNSSTLTFSITESIKKSVKFLIQVLILEPRSGKKFSSQLTTVIIKQHIVKPQLLIPSESTTIFRLPPQEEYYDVNGYKHDGLRTYQNNDTLTFKCIIKDIRESCTAENPITIPDYKMKMATNMFTSLYQNSELFDVTFIIGHAKMKAHAVVLAATCPYFRMMFNSGMKEQRDRTVDFSNDSEITPKILRGLLDYIYGVKSVEELKDIVSDLLTLAVKFDIADLKTSCAFIVSNGINKTNVASTLLFAHIHDLKILKNKALSISKMHMNDLKASKEFKDICQQVDLVKEFM